MKISFFSEITIIFFHLLCSMISARSASLTTVLLLTSFWSDKFLSDASIFNDFVKSNLFNNGVKTKTQLDNNLRGRCELKGIVLGFFCATKKSLNFFDVKWNLSDAANFHQFFFIWFGISHTTCCSTFLHRIIS